MKVYIASPLCEQDDRIFAEKIARLCEQEGFKTFLPHRDAGLFKDIKDIDRIAKHDLKELYECDILIGILNGICVGAGTAWEMGFMQALGKPVIGLKTDRKVNESIGNISVIVAGNVKIVESIDELKDELKNELRKLI
jgi:nucleoside 2-deoxyribosyltransferase